MGKRIFIILALIAISAGQARSQSVEPTDNDLKAFFNQNRFSFQKFAEMLLVERKIQSFTKYRVDNYYFDGNHSTGSSKVSFCDGKAFIKFENWRSCPEPKPALEEKCIIYCPGAKPHGSMEKDTQTGTLCLLGLEIFLPHHRGFLRNNSQVKFEHNLHYRMCDK